jgi:hypothetical protein
MMRILVVAIFGALLASCSGSNRLEDIVPAAPKNHSEGRGTLAAEPRGTPEAEPQGASKAQGQSPAEE